VNARAKSQISETTFAIHRVTVTSARPFDDVVAALYAGLGRVPNFAALVQDWSAATDRDEFDAVVGPVAGSSGLIEFLSLDLGAAVTIRDPDRGRRMLRIIAGNPVTMSKMAASVPDVGSYAPVTVLVVERAEGVTLSYDRVASAIAPYAGQEALAVAEALDTAVVTLLRDAAG
jgi:uncharacterized protein (DUF302 family)